MPLGRENVCRFGNDKSKKNLSRIVWFESEIQRTPLRAAQKHASRRRGQFAYVQGMLYT